MSCPPRDSDWPRGHLPEVLKRPLALVRETTFGGLDGGLRRLPLRVELPDLRREVSQRRERPAVAAMPGLATRGGGAGARTRPSCRTCTIRSRSWRYGRVSGMKSLPGKDTIVVAVCGRQGRSIGSAPSTPLATRGLAPSARRPWTETALRLPD